MVAPTHHPPNSTTTTTTPQSPTSPIVSPSTLTIPPPFITRQDVKDTINRTNALVKAAGKYRATLALLATVTGDFADAIADLARCRSVVAVSRGETGEALKHCGELHALMSKQLRELAERVQRDIEEPVHKSIDEHNAHVAWNEKNILQMKNNIQDKIKKAESETRKKKSRDPDQLQQALKNLNAYTTELHDLKYVHQRAILNEETRNVKTIQSHYSNLLRRQGEVHSGWGIGSFKIAEELVKGVAVAADIKNGSLPRPQDGPKTEKYGASRQSMDDARGRDKELAPNAVAVGRLLVSGKSASASAGSPTPRMTDHLQHPLPKSQALAVPHSASPTSHLQQTALQAANIMSTSAPPPRTALNRRGSLDSNSGAFSEPRPVDMSPTGSFILERKTSSTKLDDATPSTAATPQLAAVAGNSSLASTLTTATSSKPTPQQQPSATTKLTTSTTTPSQPYTQPATHKVTTQTATPPPSPALHSSSPIPPSALQKAATSDDKTKEKKRVRFPHQQPIATVATESDEDDEDLTSLEVPSGSENGMNTPGNLTSTLSSLYPHIFGSERPLLSSVPVQRVAVQNTSNNNSSTALAGGGRDSPVLMVSGGGGSGGGSVGFVAVKMPEVYVSQEADVESQMGSIVGVTESLVGLPEEVDMVYAIHDFAARSAKEMSLAKGDVITVRKRQGTWIYGTKVPRTKTSLSLPNNASNNNDKASSSFADRFRRGPPQGGAAGKGAAEDAPQVGWIPMAFVAKFSPN
ncbi:hypothetical protein HK097_008922 [Rhizophlyctis rosea]|uniref:SH3 domain-containing protein n=1 Tax=Rhizophlyctis rosea TaxID=64517 RepID=A0AAD5SCD0_9FUNG|nr:hypothetical protein HK097_008922 [Rhizophlyctis rosea]